MYSKYSSAKAFALYQIIQGKIRKGVKFVIIDGFDKEGKSTFGKQVAKLIGWNYIHYPLTSLKYENTWKYIEEMLETFHITDNTVIDRYVFSTIVYGDISEHVFYVKILLKAVARDGFLVVGGMFDELLYHKLKMYPDLLSVYEKIPKVSVYPWLFREPDFRDTLAHMRDQDSVNWIRSKLMINE